MISPELSRTVTMTQIKRTIRRPELLAQTGLSKTSIYNLEREGKFPLHFMLTPRCAVWAESEVDAWLDERQSAPSSAVTFLMSQCARAGVNRTF
jgi:prophage regulatory protein